MRLLLVLLIAAASIPMLRRPARAEGDGPSLVVYPPQRIPLTFSHQQHQARGVACLTCHPTAATSESAVDRLLPGERECARCHPIDRAQLEGTAAGGPPSRCLACHPGFAPGQPVARIYVPPPNLKFSHARHAKLACTGCHGAVVRTDLATRADLPTMESCLTCHDGKSAAGTCAQCHPTAVGGLLRTRFFDGELKPSGAFGDAHRSGFAGNHGAAARAAGASCKACHGEDDCADCHAGVVRPLEFHAAGYERTHAFDARRGKPDCTACHRQQTYCLGCHERTGVAARGESAFGSADPVQRFHPPGWTESSSMGLHGGAARRNLDTCVSCHREEFCLTCHSAQPGAMRASPHPRGWRGSARCRDLQQKNGRMCLRCHVQASEAGCDWSAATP
jgi:hypothetical protein